MRKFITLTLLLIALPCLAPAASLPQPKVKIVYIDYYPAPPRVANWSTLIQYLRWLKLYGGL